MFANLNRAEIRGDRKRKTNNKNQNHKTISIKINNKKHFKEQNKIEEKNR